MSENFWLRDIFDTYYLTSSEISISKEYSERIVINYDNRNQKNEVSNRQQHLIGKLGEFVLYNKLSFYIDGLSKPDTEIYSINKKNYNSDILCGKLEFCCKTQDAVSRQAYEPSWIVQYSNRVGRGGKDKRIFEATDGESKNIYVVFVSVDLHSMSGNIEAIVELGALRSNNLFKDPRLESKINIKKAIYLKDIETLGLAKVIPDSLVNKILMYLVI
jgi:hypothetical protein